MMVETNKEEIWKDCKGYEGLYQISNQGRLWSIRRQTIMTQHIKKDGYYEVVLTAKNGKKKYERIHRLVALAFLDNPNCYPVVNHKDGNKTNNCADNLEWCSIAQNTKHAYDNDLGGFKDLLKRNCEKAREVNLKTYEIYYKGEFIASVRGLEEASKIAKCNEKTIRNCIKENRSSRSGYSFKKKGGDE